MTTYDGAHGFILIYGAHLYGDVHQVPGACRVATVFYHGFQIPLIPRRSYLVVEGVAPPVGATTPTGEVIRSQYDFVGVRIPLNWWSVFVGYGRGLLGTLMALVAIIAAAFTWESTVEGKPGAYPAEVGWVIVAGLGAVFAFSLYLTRAGWARANELRAALGLPTDDAV